MRKAAPSPLQLWSSAHWRLPPPPLSLALGPVEITLSCILTFLALGSIAIFLEDAVYLYKNTSCPIKRRTLLWMSSAPTVRALELPPRRDWRRGRDHVEKSSKLNSACHYHVRVRVYSLMALGIRTLAWKAADSWRRCSVHRWPHSPPPRRSVSVKS